MQKRKIDIHKVAVESESLSEKMGAMQELINMAVSKMIEEEERGNVIEAMLYNVRRKALSDAMQVLSRKGRA